MTRSATTGPWQRAGPGVARAAGPVLGGLAIGVAAGLVALRAGGDVGPALGWTLGWGLPATRAALDLLGVVVVGLGTVALLLAGVRRAGDALRTVWRASVVAGAAWAVAALSLLWLQVAQALGQGVLDVRTDGLADYIGAAAAGRALLVTAACGLVVVVVAALALHQSREGAPAGVPAGLPIVPAVLGLLALPITGHAATAPAHEVAVLSVAVHVAVVSVWVGGFLVLAAVLLTRRELLAAVLPRFSRLALWCVLLVAATGVGNALLTPAPPGAVLTSAYGVLLLAKTVGALALAALGGWARRWLIPRVAARRPVGVGGWISVELAVMGAVLGLAAVLAGSPPPVG